MYSKFFDNQFPLPLHVHHRDEHAAALGKKGKPEAYYFPPQLNSHLGELGVTFFGLHPETTKAQVAERLARFAAGGDNRITELSRGYRIQLGTGLGRARRRAPRPRERLHLRAAARQRRRVPVRVLVEQPRGDERAALEGRAARTGWATSTTSSSCSTGSGTSTRTSGPAT